MNKSIRQSYLNEMGIISWQSRATHQSMLLMRQSAFVYYIRVDNKNIILLADFQPSETHVQVKAEQLVNAICNAIGANAEGGYVSCFEDAVNEGAVSIAIVLGDLACQNILSSLDGASIIFSKHSINQLMDNPLLKDTIWHDICGLGGK